MNKTLTLNLIIQFIPDSEPHALAKEAGLSALRCFDKVDIKRALLSIGTLGGGNHFIEVDRDDDGRLYLIVHSGSRHLGVEVAEYYQAEAYRHLNGSDEESKKALIASLKAAGRSKDIDAELKKLKNTKRTDTARELAYVEGRLFDDYIHDMKTVQRFASLNRQAVIEEILKETGLTKEDQFSTIHNYIDTDDMILRKGAVSAKKGERLLIPINMRDGSLLCEGLGNEETNFSAPHGAGRLMSRSQAKKQLSTEEFAEQMRNVFTTSVGYGTLDESPMAYKDISNILDNLSFSARVIKRLHTVYNFKAGE